MENYDDDPTLGVLVRSLRKLSRTEGLVVDSPTERWKTERRMTEHRMTKRRKTEHWMTKHRMTEHRIGPNDE
jgi:hypothetical protein